MRISHKFSVAIVCLFAFLAACTFVPTSSTKSNQDKYHGADIRTPATHTELSSEDTERIHKMVVDKDSNHFMQQLLKLRIAQTLVSSFDIRLEKLKSEVELDQLFESNLYCKLMDIRPKLEHATEQLLLAYAYANSMGSDYVNWYFSEMTLFAKIDIPRKATMAQLYRTLLDEQENICNGAVNCVETVDARVNLISALGFSPANSSQMNLFMKKNRNAIAVYAVASAASIKQDMAPGNCFEHVPNRKPQQVTFDWVNRNWIGSVLPVGQFVFTYDDGPHAVHTKVIRDAWAQAGMAKPAFFWLRKNASSLPAVVQELNQQGYVIGSHSERHADLGSLARANSYSDMNGVDKQAFPEAAKLSGQSFVDWKNATLTREIDQSVKDLGEMIGKPVRYFRLPYGSGTKNDLIGKHFQAMNLDHFFWRIDSLDWQDKNPESIRDRVVAQMKISQKGIVLFHDIHPQSAAASKLLVEYLKKNPSMKAVPITSIPGLKP